MQFLRCPEVGGWPKNNDSQTIRARRRRELFIPPSVALQTSSRAKTFPQSLLYTMQNVFGGGERIGRLLPGVAGEQICAWWSGSAPGGGHLGPDQVGKGYVWSFEKGVDHPTSRFKAEGRLGVRVQILTARRPALTRTLRPEMPEHPSRVTGCA